MTNVSEDSAYEFHKKRQTDQPVAFASFELYSAPLHWRTIGAHGQIFCTRKAPRKRAIQKTTARKALAKRRVSAWTVDVDEQLSIHGEGASVTWSWAVTRKTCLMTMKSLRSL